MDSEIVQQLEQIRQDNAALKSQVAALSQSLSKTQRKLSRRIEQAEDTALIPWDWINVAGILLCVGSVWAVDTVVSVKLPNLNPFKTQSQTQETITPIPDQAANSSDVPKPGEPLAGFEVTSGWGPRSSPCAGCSSFHRGIDVGAPVGSPVKALGKPGEMVTVQCNPDDGMGHPYSIQTAPSMPDLQIEVLHLSQCNPGQYPAGTVHSYSGDAGTGPHYHIQVRRLSKQGDEFNGLFPPPRWAVEGVITGVLKLGDAPAIATPGTKITPVTTEQTVKPNGRTLI